MCRVFAYLSINPILLDDVFRRPTNALTKQVDGDFQDQSFYNVDGYGFTWYSDTRAKFNPLLVSNPETDALKKPDSAEILNTESTEAKIHDGPLLPFVKGPHPAMYKTITAQPLNDPCFVSFCANVASRCIFGHMRAATVPPVTTSNCHPFVFGRHSFMHNGGIDRFAEVRKDILDNVASGFVAMIGGSCDTEHLAALYMTYLCPEGRKDFLGADDHYSAKEMKTALKATVEKVLEIQEKRGIKDPDNYFNICATDGESMIGLCYRTNTEGKEYAPLWLSVSAADNLNRKTCYLAHGTIDCGHDHKPTINIEKTSTVLKRSKKATGINADILKKVVEEEQSLADSEHGPHVIIASEPATMEPGWYKLLNHEFVMVDTVYEGPGKAARTISISGEVF